ncbi:MAG: diguanylate cyclase [Negativicutes bacterium]|nr:diguanylate cyclase [Negativicutes bacterium]
MNQEIMEHLIVNAAILIVCAAFYLAPLENYRKKSLGFEIVLGIVPVIFAIIMIRSMSHFNPVYGMDAKFCVAGLTALFLGIIPAAVTVLLLSAFLLLLGGPAAPAAILMLFVAAAIGLIWQHYLGKRLLSGKTVVCFDFYLFGLLLSFSNLLCFAVFPAAVLKDLLSSFALPMLLVYPLSISIAGTMITAQKSFRLSRKKVTESELRFRALFHTAPIGIAIEVEDHFLYCNPLCEKILGRSKQDIDQQGWINLSPAGDAAETPAQLKNHLTAAIHEYVVEKRVLRADGSLIWLQLSLLSLAEKELFGEHAYAYFLKEITETVTAKKQRETALEDYRVLYHQHKTELSLLQSLFASTAEWIYYKDLNHVYLGCNKAFARFCGLTEKEIIGKKPAEIFEVSRVKAFSLYEEAAITEQKTTLCESDCMDAQGRQSSIELLQSPYYDETGKIQGVVGVGHDSTERKRREAEIQYLSDHDALTGVYNRAYFEKEKMRLERTNALPVSLIVCDINGLKQINDAYGHEEGDALLLALVQKLQECCRPSDLIIRVAGDDFYIILPETDAETVVTVYEKMIKAIAILETEPAQHQYYASTAAAYASKTTSTQSLDDILKIAEEYLYNRKLLAQSGIHSKLLVTLMSALHEKSNETQEHAERMARMATELGRQLSMPLNDLDTLALASALHDIGKINIDFSILNKPGQLNDEEWQLMKQHPDVGYRIAQSVPQFAAVKDIIRSHHERWDGKGYPQGLVGEAIPLPARLIAVVDAYDAMTEDRVYRKARSRAEAIAEIEKSAGTQFDPNIARVFIDQVLLQATEVNS